MNKVTQSNLSKEIHLNSLLSAIRNIYRILLRNDDSLHLIKGITERFSEPDGILGAWIVLLDEQGKYLASSQAGLGEGFLIFEHSLKSGAWDHIIQKVQKSSLPIVIDYPHKICKDRPLRNHSERCTGLALRLRHNKKDYGVLSIAVDYEFRDDPEQNRLFQEMAMDIAFKLSQMEQQTH